MQPQPKPGYGDVTADLIGHIQERQRKGIETYGTKLQYGNGRSSLQDALEEAMDMPQYLLQLKGELAGVLELLEKLRCVWSIAGMNSKLLNQSIARLRTIIGAA